MVNKHGENVEEKSLTICSGTDYININMQHVICPDAATAKVSTRTPTQRPFFQLPKSSFYLICEGQRTNRPKNRATMETHGAFWLLPRNRIAIEPTNENEPFAAYLIAQ